MILEAVYEGRHPRVTVPGFAGKSVARGVKTKIRIPDGYALSPSWKITKGEAEYKAALAAADEEREARKKARAKFKEEQRERIRAEKDAAQAAKIERMVARGEVDATVSKKPEGKSAKGGDAS